MEENKKTTSPSNVVYASLGSSQYPRARLFSHMFEYFVIFFSSAFHGKAKEIVNLKRWTQFLPHPH